MRAEEFINRVNVEAQAFVQSLTPVKARQLGLDSRAGYQLYIGEDVIAVDRDQDRSLQYYGGFEYVDKNYRTEVGDFVFYSANDSRVYDVLEYYQNPDDEGDDE